MNEYVVCGWYTPDYAHWADRLKGSLERFSQPYDLVQVEKPARECWEQTTLRKAREVLLAMQRNPGKTIVMLDVDCVVAGDLRPLSNLRGDLAFYFHPRRRRSGHAKTSVRSGTLVVKPTAEATRFVERWASLSERSRFGDVDQDTLLLALETAGVLFEQLDVKWCCTKSDNCESPMILHDCASRNARKISTTRRRFVSLANRIVDHAAIGERMRALTAPRPLVPEAFRDDHLVPITVTSRRRGQPHPGRDA